MTKSPIARKRHRRRKYSSEPLATVPPESDLGPAMLRLTEKQRRFVLELKLGPVGYGSEVRAARAAGYRGNDGSIKVTAHNVLHNPRVQEALREVGGKLIRAEAFQSIKTTAAIARDMRHKDCLRANLALMDRSFPVETHHHVTVERTPEMLIVATEEVIERIRQLTAKLGLPAIKQIDGVATPLADAEAP
jgi:phage terminase small subunit